MLAAWVVDSFAKLNPTQMILLALTIAAMTVLLGSTRRRIRRSASQSGPSVRERYQELSEQRSAVRDVENVMVELEQLSREIHGRLDTKIAKLERLIRDADVRISRLVPTASTTLGSTALDVTVADDQNQAPRPTAAPGSEHQRIYQLAGEGLSASQIAGRVGRLAGEVELILSLRRAREAQTALNPA